MGKVTNKKKHVTIAKSTYNKAVRRFHKKSMVISSDIAKLVSDWKLPDGVEYMFAKIVDNAIQNFSDIRDYCDKRNIDINKFYEDMVNVTTRYEN